MIPEFWVRFVYSVGIVYLHRILRCKSGNCECHSHTVVFVARYPSS